MSDQVILCPHCQKEIPLNEAITHQIKEGLTAEIQAAVNEREQVLDKRSQAIAKQERELETSKKTLDEQVAERVKAKEKDLLKQAEDKAKEANAVELKDLRAQLEEKASKLAEAQKAELEVRKKQRQVEEREKALELEMTRKLDKERERIQTETAKLFTEEHRLKDLEKDKQVSDLVEQIDELKRKAQQGSQQTQGEVLELELENMLRTAFPFDDIEPVPKGRRGADVLQRVKNASREQCGTIIWESKRTQNWSDGWISKLRDDQRDVKAEIAVLLTTVLPKTVRNFAYRDGVWITDYTSIVGLATALRINLIQVAMEKLAAVGKNEKMEFLYRYLSGPQFRQRVQAIVESFVSMKQQLDQEKRAMSRLWAKRDKDIERIVDSTASMYGDIQGIVGASLPEIEDLELRSLASGTEDASFEEDPGSD